MGNSQREISVCSGTILWYRKTRIKEHKKHNTQKEWNKRPAKLIRLKQGQKKLGP